MKKTKKIIEVQTNLKAGAYLGLTIEGGLGAKSQNTTQNASAAGSSSVSQ